VVVDHCRMSSKRWTTSGELGVVGDGEKRRKWWTTRRGLGFKGGGGDTGAGRIEGRVSRPRGRWAPRDASGTRNAIKTSTDNRRVVIILVDRRAASHFHAGPRHLARAAGVPDRILPRRCRRWVPANFLARGRAGMFLGPPVRPVFMPRTQNPHRAVFRGHFGSTCRDAPRR
jgi:hypothetical protein